MSIESTPLSSSAIVTPVATSERLPLVDILRGFSLLGILLVNFEGDIGSFVPRLDTATRTVLDVLVAQSFYPLFSFLFGLGFAIQLLRARERGAGATVLYLRRMLVLFLIGTFHALIIWRGDILAIYALSGLLLIPLQKVHPRILLAIVIVMAVLSCFRLPVTTVLRTWSAGSQSELVDGLRSEEMRILNNRKTREDEHGGSYATSVAGRWYAYGAQIRIFTDWTFIIVNDIVMLFILGFYVGRRGLLQRAHEYRRGLRVVAIIGLVGAVAANAYQFLWTDLLPQLEMVAYPVSNYGATAFYIAAIALLVTAGGRAARAFGVFAHAGRMALTNYLMQSIAMTLLFNGYALALTDPGEFSRLLLNVAFFFAVQIPLSRWWLDRYHFGPAEWLWRSATYGRLQPMRRAPVAVPIEAVTI